MSVSETRVIDYGIIASVVGIMLSVSAFVLQVYLNTIHYIVHTFLVFCVCTLSTTVLALKILLEGGRRR